MNTNDALSTLAWQINNFCFSDFARIKNYINEDLKDAKNTPGISAKLKDFLELNSRWIEISQSYLLQIEDRGARIIHPFSEDYPNGFRCIADPPLCLTVLGKVSSWQQNKLLAVVGSREPASYSLRWLHAALAWCLTLKPMTIVSGAARGVDQCAHRVALGAKVPTVAFLPTGINKIYPRDFLLWERDIVEGGGAIISEYAPEVEIRKHHFRLRNRLIAALSDACLVVEAKMRSGSLMTGNLCFDNDIPLGVVPGHPTDFRYQGSLELILSGGQIIRDKEDLLTLMNQLSFVKIDLEN